MEFFSDNYDISQLFVQRENSIIILLIKVREDFSWLYVNSSIKNKLKEKLHFMGFRTSVIN